jgi:hypothetical protein
VVKNKLIIGSKSLWLGIKITWVMLQQVIWTQSDINQSECFGLKVATAADSDRRPDCAMNEWITCWLTFSAFKCTQWTTWATNTRVGIECKKYALVNAIF